MTGDVFFCGDGTGEGIPPGNILRGSASCASWELEAAAAFAAARACGRERRKVAKKSARERLENIENCVDKDMEGPRKKYVTTLSTCTTV